MALQWFDGGDYITTAVWPSASGISPWDSITDINHVRVSSADARTGLNGYGFNPSGANPAVIKTMSTNLNSGYVGFAYRQNGVTYVGSNPVSFVDVGVTQVSVAINGVGQIQAFRGLGGTQIAISSLSIPLQVYVYIEVFVKIGTGTSGEVDVWVNGVQYINAPNINTQNSGASTFNNVFFGFWNNVGSGSISIDDIYILDTTGPAPWNTRLGDVEVVAFVPTGSGAFTQWTPVGNAQNWQNENLIPSKAFTFYNDTTASGQRDSYTYTFTQPINTGSIFGVMPMGLMETVSAGTRTVELTARQSGVDLFSPSYTLGVGFVYILKGGGSWVLETDVNGNIWSITNLQATEFGVDEIT